MKAMRFLAVAIIWSLSFIASAASLTSAQTATLKGAALADPVAATYITNGQDQLLADWLNANQPNYWVWRSVFTSDQARSAIMAGIAQLDNLTVSKRDSLLWVFSVNTVPSDPTVPASMDALCGTQNTLKAELQNAIRRTATRAEKALASGAGTNIAPSTLGWEGVFDAALASTVRGY